MIFEELTYVERKEIEQKINDYLHENFEACLKEDKLKEFSQEYIRTGQEIVNENIEYFNIRCPYEFLDKKEIISRDEDYIRLGYGYYLNEKRLFDDGIDFDFLSPISYTYRGVEGQEEIEIYYKRENDKIWLHIIDPDAPYGESSYFLVDHEGMNLSVNKIEEIIKVYMPNAEYGG